MMPAADMRAYWTDLVRSRLGAVAGELRRQGVPVPALEGKVLRPVVALALVPPALRGHLDERFWYGALALQMVHEASLLHDDILDGAPRRRGRETLVSRAGVGPALVLGDHYLTGAYRAAARVESAPFMERFVMAVERTVAGEIQQGRSVGRRLSPREYREVITGKSGELFGAAASLGGALFNLGDLDGRVRFGRDLGALYQQVDDLLDYCTHTQTGKPPLQDYRHEKWTWVLELAGLEGFHAPEDEVLEAVFGPDASGVSAAERAVGALKEAQTDLLERAALLSPGDALSVWVLEGWMRLAQEAVDAQPSLASIGVGP